LIACLAQFIGALSVGFGSSWIDSHNGPPDNAVAGMLMGGVVGIILGEIICWNRSHSGKVIDEMSIPCCRCGYDLRGNVSGKCPECGTPINSGDR